MRLLFLDIDGVLNHSEYIYTNRARAKVLGEQHPELTWDEISLIADLDPKKVELLNLICSEVEDLEIVVSSAWRKLNTLGAIWRALRHQGFNYRLRGVTPGSKDGIRGGEIKEYLSTQEGVTSVAIVDDSHDLQPFMHLLVSTDFNEGLMEHQAREIIRLLKEDSYEP